ncbi:hypothetical protein [Acidithiobacillus sulfurivorans]|uniref:Uncharacterized protein n=1 Tax=Acidithiobacillus sulfurivorans TaxID=1958756 RepID=A0ABS5ZW02_9PROT|nr:hypothetical protein [Acidithiobacillus sulfurivorans]MBU2758625.1 hypothetical protein [Acidithiobacillus sulfurivorans]
MSRRGLWVVVKDSLITQMQSGHVATVKQSLTVHVDAGRAATTEKSSVVQIPEETPKQWRPCHGVTADHFRGVTKMIKLEVAATCRKFRQVRTEDTRKVTRQTARDHASPQQDEAGLKTLETKIKRRPKT